MSDKLQMATELMNDFITPTVKELVNKKPWMNDVKFTLVTKRQDLEALVDRLIAQGICALDLETTSLNTRQDSDGKSVARLVGICLAPSADEGFYVPVGHRDKEYNVPEEFALRELKRLVFNCRCIYHNFKYDGQVMYNYGIYVTDLSLIEDTFLLAGVEDASRRERGLKHLSEGILGRQMIEFGELGGARRGKKTVVSFDLVPPLIAVYYGGGDAANTFGLFRYFEKKLNEQDPQGTSGPWKVYRQIEKPCLLATMEMERNLTLIDREFLRGERKKVVGRMESIVEEVYELAGRKFDLASPKQLGTILFEEMKIKYPEKERTASGQYMTSEATLSKIKNEAPIVKLILDYRSYQKTVGTYIDNWLKNCDEKSQAKFQLNQLRADTGRYSASGGRGYDVDGYCGVNCQNIPLYDSKEHTSIDLRKAVVAHPGYKIVTVDYSGEELRIAANFSHEPKWLYEFLKGSADLHTMTARIIYNKQVVDKPERNIGKRLNFLTIYGGTAVGFSAVAKIPYETAKKMLINFFREYTGLKKWIEVEALRSKKRGYSKTFLGRRRPLGEFYASTDHKIQSKGDRCAINSAVQGCLQPHVRCLTDKGYVPIKEIEQRKETGEAFRVWTGTSWETFDVLNRGACQLATIELENGLRLDCDTRHEVLVVGDSGYVFKKFKDLEEGDEVCVSIPQALEFGNLPERRHFSGGQAHNSRDVLLRSANDCEFAAYLLGVVIGDGHIRTGNRNSVTVSFGKQALSKLYVRIKDGLRNWGLTFTTPRRTKDSYGESYQSDVNSKALVSLFEYFGYKKADARHKRVPELIFRCPLTMRRAFLKGYFDADGCKKADNRYSIHNANQALLQDVQVLAWTLGLASYVKELSDGSYKLSWSDLTAVEHALGIQLLVRRKRTGGTMLLPSFLYSSVYKTLKDAGRYVGENNDRALVCNLHKKRKILVPTVVSLLDKYDCYRPTMYYHYKLKSKTHIGKTEETYTLSVHSPLHRFDSAVIISKNTGADIIKIALYRIWKWIRDNGFEEDVRILMPVHDEIVFEIKEDKLDYYVPEICEIMVLRDIVEKLKWPVPLTVDAEYGDSFHVTQDFWKERAENPDAPPPPTDSEPVEDKQESPTPSGANPDTAPQEPTTVTPPPRVDGTSEDSTYYHFDVTVRNVVYPKEVTKEKAQKTLEVAQQEEEIDPALKDVRIRDRIDHRGVFMYPLERMDPVTLQQLTIVLKLLTSHGADQFIGPTCKVCFTNTRGEVWYETTQKVPIDALVALCLWLKI